MPRGVASAKQLAAMTKVLDEFCSDRMITDANVREDLGSILLRLFD
jgi:hypothetical protein